MMKKVISILTLIMLCLLTACSTQESPKSTGIDPEAFAVLDAGVWPENEYTGELPVPAGTVNNAYVDTKNDYCVIMIDDMSETEFDEYIASLESAGYTEIEYVAEEIKGEDYTSIGTLYSNGTTSTSISFADGNLGMYIVIERDVQ